VHKSAKCANLFRGYNRGAARGWSVVAYFTRCAYLLAAGRKRQRMRQ